MNRFFNFLHKSNLFISLAATTLYLYYSLLLQNNFFLTTPIFIFSSTYVAYTLLRFIPFLQKREINQDYALWYSEHTKFTWITAIFFFILGLLCLPDLSFIQMLLVSLITIITVFYDHILPHKLKLRTIPFAKPFIIGITWSGVCVGLNLEVVDKESILHLIDAFLFITLLCLPFDYKDRVYDDKQKTQTLMNRFGKYPYLLVTLILVYMLYLIYYMSFISPFTFEYNLLLQLIVYGWVFYGLKKRSHFSALKADLLTDGIIFIKCLPVLFYFR